MRVRIKVILLVVAFFLFLALFFLFLLHRGTERFLKESFLEESQRVQKSFLLLVEREKEKLVRQLRDYTMWTDMGKKGVQQKDREWLAENLDPWVSEQFGYEVCLVDENGEEIAVSSSWVLPWRMIPFSQEGSWVGFYAHENGLWMVASSPVMDNVGEHFFGAFLFFAMFLDEAVLREWSEISGEKVYYQPSGRRGWGDVEQSFSKDFAYWEGILKMSFPLEGQEVIGTFFVEKSYRMPLRLYEITRWIFFSVLLGMALFGFFLSRFLAEWILKPLEYLRNSVVLIAQGEYKVEFATKRQDEFGTLAESFIQMAEALKEREENLKMEKKRAERLAQLDVLTNLPNRRFLEEWVGEAVREKEKFTLVFIDLDGFKKVNDLLGHTEGDILLEKIASWFEHKIRKEDVVVRYGGDEFCFLFPGLGRKETEEIMRRILVNFEEESFVEGLVLRFSYGIAVYPEEAKNMDELLAHSDGEMYAQKRKKSFVDW